MDPEDLLNLENDSNIKNKIGNEKIYFSDKIKKWKFGKIGLLSKFENRNILITNLAIYNLKKNEIKRRIKIEDLYGITYSTASTQFIIHFNENDYDYLFQSDNRDKMIKMLQNLYENIKNQDILFSVKDEKELTKYVVNKKERRGNPYLFKLDKNCLKPIKEFFEENGGSGEQGKKDDFENVDNQEEENQEQEPEKPPVPQMPKFTPPPPKPQKQPKPPKAPKPPKEEPVKVIAVKSKGVPPPPPPPPPPPTTTTPATGCSCSK